VGRWLWKLFLLRKKHWRWPRNRGGVVGGGRRRRHLEFALARWGLGSGVPFGILPQGTSTTSAASCYGIISRNRNAARLPGLIARSSPSTLGLLNDSLSRQCQLGLYPATLLETAEAYRQRFGRSRLVALCRHLVTCSKAAPATKVQIAYEGKQRTLRTRPLCRTNNALQLKTLGLDQEGRLSWLPNHLVAITSKPLQAHSSSIWCFGGGLLSRWRR